MDIVVTGEVRSGKTTWCKRYSRWLATRNLSVGGILCSEVRTRHARLGYDVTDIQSNQSAVFGRLASITGFAGETAGSYTISHAGIEFAVRAIRNAIDEKRDVVFMDEIGHLELAGRGVMAAASEAYAAAQHTVSVVRRSLLETFLQCVPRKEPAIIFVIEAGELVRVALPEWQETLPVSKSRSPAPPLTLPGRVGGLPRCGILVQ